VIEHLEGETCSHLIRFTSIPPEMDAYFQALLQYDAEE
jgi:hypothetical protein